MLRDPSSLEIHTLIFLRLLRLTHSELKLTHNKLKFTQV